MSTDELNITRNKKHLEKIREEGEKDGGNQFSSRGHAASGEGSNEQAQGSGTGNPRRAEGREERAGENNGTPQGHGTGIRPLESAPLDATPGTDTDHREPAQRRIDVVAPPELTPEQKRERELELQRQRQQRYIDRKKAEETGQVARELVTSRQSVKDGPQFTLKNPFAKRDAGEKVKLFTNKEAEEELTRMQDIYFRGSGLLDDLLEIVVKDHEPVQIWQVSEEEAEMLATMHLERAKRDEGAARSARKLLEIYDRLYFWMLVYPRMQATGRHVIAHKGFSFR